MEIKYDTSMIYVADMPKIKQTKGVMQKEKTDDLQRV